MHTTACVEIWPQALHVVENVCVCITFMTVVLFVSTGRHFKTTATYALSTPIYMDNVGCHGTEDRIIDCAYHTDTSEDRHSGDIWIECDTASKPDPDKKPETGQKNEGPQSDGQAEKRVVSERGSDVGLAVALVALVISLVVVFALIAVLLYKKQRRIRQTIRLI